MSVGGWVTVVGVLAVALLFLIEDEEQKAVLKRLEVGLNDF